MNVLARARRWLIGLCCGSTVVGAALLAPCSRAEAPPAKPRAKSGVSAPSQDEPAKAKPKAGASETPAPAKTKAKANANAKAKAKAKAKQKQAKVARAKPRAPKEEAALDVASGPDQACHVQLRKAGVSFVKVITERAPNVLLPIRLTGAVAGVEIRGSGKKVTHYLDCRLGLALVRWAPQLRAAGVVAIDHFSIYRPDAQVAATRKPSGHSLAMAIDAGRFHMRDGRTLTVLEHWTDKTKGADPCAPRPGHGADERLLRELVCDASRRGIFQTVVTPHHNPEHDNHVHLEVSGSFAPAWMH